MLAMFSPGPKSRSTAAYLAIFLGWAGVHKFYLVYHQAGIAHLALTWAGGMALVAQFFLPTGSRILVYVLVWLAILLGYFYVRRFQLGHTMGEVLMPGLLLLSPWRLVQRIFALAGTGGAVLVVLVVLACLAVAGAIVIAYYLIFTLVAFLAIAASVIIGAVEGARYLTEDDDQFQQDYVLNRRPWF